MEELQQLVKRKDVRSADRASMRSMLDKLRHGRPLSYQERQNLWAYIVRYSHEHRQQSVAPNTSVGPVAIVDAEKESPSGRP